MTIDSDDSDELVELNFAGIAIHPAKTGELHVSNS